MNDEKPVEHNFAYNHEISKGVYDCKDLDAALSVLSKVLSARSARHLENLVDTELSKRQGLAE